METSYYKNIQHVQNPVRVAQALNAIQQHLREDRNRLINMLTGEIEKEYYPDICRSKSRKKVDFNFHEQQLWDTYGKQLKFYTLNLIDYQLTWGQYDTIFTKTEQIQRLIRRVIKGPFIAVIQVSAYSGPHVHIVCLKQNYKLLKAETDVYDYLGLLKYLARSQISQASKKSHPTDYEVMVGMYLLAKAEASKKGKRLSRRRFWRLVEE